MIARRVLLIDDEAEFAQALTIRLETHGYQVAIAHDGVMGLHLADTQPFDAVLVDIVMPGLDGYEVCRRLRAREKTAKLPIVALTASAGREFEAKARAAGATATLAKPFESSMLTALLEHLFGGQGASRDGHKAPVGRRSLEQAA